MTEHNIISHVVVNKMTITHDNIIHCEELRTQFASFSATSIVRLVTCRTMNVSTSLSIGIGNKIPYNYIPLEPKPERSLLSRFRIIRSSLGCGWEGI